MCLLTSCTCSECRRYVSMTCAVTSARRCCSEVDFQNPPANDSFSSPCTQSIPFPFFSSAANTTRIFEGSRIVKTGMVSGPEDGDANFLFVSLSCLNSLSFAAVLLSPLFLQLPRQTWLPSARVPPLGPPLVFTSPSCPWQLEWVPPLVAVRPQWLPL